MARRQKTTVAVTQPRRGAKAAPERAARSRKAPEAEAEIEVVEEEAGLGIDEGIIIVSTLCILAAIVITDYALGTYYGGGWFFS
jgi:hypothetical protein